MCVFDTVVFRMNWRVEQLQHQRASSNDSAASRQKVFADDALQNATLAARLTACVVQFREHKTIKSKTRGETTTPKQKRAIDEPTTTICGSSRTKFDEASPLVVLVPAIVKMSCNLLIIGIKSLNNNVGDCCAVGVDEVVCELIVRLE